MSSLRLYIDEDAEQHAVIDGLRARNVDVLTTTEASRLGAEDNDQLAFAAGAGRAIYTFNVRDFARLHAQYMSSATTHPGIIIISDQRYSIGVKVRRLAELVATVTAEDMVNRMEYL